MRDAYDAMIWNDHHDQFSEWLDEALKGAARRIGGAFSPASAVPGQFVAAVMAVGLTIATVGASAA